jgi:hypothetical protein
MINNLTVREYINKKSANLLLGWCIEKYGPSKYNNLKTLKIQIDPNHIHFGMYEPCQNTIILNPKRHPFQTGHGKIRRIPNKLRKTSIRDNV